VYDLNEFKFYWAAALLFLFFFSTAGSAASVMSIGASASSCTCAAAECFFLRSLAPELESPADFRFLGAAR
jgi:hypothetical protein